MKREENTKEINKEEVLKACMSKLDNIIGLTEQTEAFSRLIEDKLLYIQKPLTSSIVKPQNKAEENALILFDIRQDINNYIMLVYASIQHFNKINEIVKEVQSDLDAIKQ